MAGGEQVGESVSKLRAAQRLRRQGAAPSDEGQ
jgi:hypothetical protein